MIEEHKECIDSMKGVAGSSVLKCETPGDTTTVTGGIHEDLQLNRVLLRMRATAGQGQARGDLHQGREGMAHRAPVRHPRRAAGIRDRQGLRQRAGSAARHLPDAPGGDARRPTASPSISAKAGSGATTSGPSPDRVLHAASPIEGKRIMSWMKMTGYADKFGVHPETPSSSSSIATVLPNTQAEIVKMIHGDTNPRGPGLHRGARSRPTCNATYKGAKQEIYSGSYGFVADKPQFRVESVTLQCWIWPTTPKTHPKYWKHGAQGLVDQVVRRQGLRPVHQRGRLRRTAHQRPGRSPPAPRCATMPGISSRRPSTPRPARRCSTTSRRSSMRWIRRSRRSPRSVSAKLTYAPGTPTVIAGYCGASERRAASPGFGAGRAS